jgi:hypothetical protein
MHCIFRCPGSSYLGRAMVSEARRYDWHCLTTGQGSRYAKLSNGVKNICKLETGISLGGKQNSEHIKRLSGRGFKNCVYDLDWGQHYAPDSKCCTKISIFELVDHHMPSLIQSTNLQSPSPTQSHRAAEARFVRGRAEG